MKNSEQIDLTELLENKKYKNLSLSKLELVIDYDLKFEDFEKMDGKYAKQKAEILYNQWHK